MVQGIAKPRCGPIGVRSSSHAVILLSALQAFLFVFLLAAPAFAQEPQVAAAAGSPPVFEVASIKPARPEDSDHNWNSARGRVSIENYTLRQLIREAYGLKSDSQVIGGPDWIGKRAFDIEAKLDDAEATKIQSMSGPERRQVTQARRSGSASRSFPTQSDPCYAEHPRLFVGGVEIRRKAHAFGAAA